MRDRNGILRGRVSASDDERFGSVLFERICAVSLLDASK